MRYYVTLPKTTPRQRELHPRLCFFSNSSPDQEEEAFHERKHNLYIMTLKKSNSGVFRVTFKVNPYSLDNGTRYRNDVYIGL